MDKAPEDRDARLAFLEGWAKDQRSRLTAEEKRRLYAEEIARVVAQARQRIGQADPLREVSVIPVVITKPSDHPVDRAAVFADLMVRLADYRWADPIVSECDEPRYIAPQALDLARKHHPGAPWLLYMEDDVILGPDFGLLPGLLREADELFPHAGMVSFFSLMFDDPGWSTHPMQEFGCVQCAAIRNTDHLVGFGAFIESAMTQSASKQPTPPRTRHEFLDFAFGEVPDLAVGNFLAAEYDAFALWCPSLVQHADLTSVFFDQTIPGRRTSRSYEQAYG